MVEIRAEMETNLGAAMRSARYTAARVRYYEHRLSHVPFLLAIGGIGVWSVLALLYRIAN